jgi:hypothetical protein
MDVVIPDTCDLELAEKNKPQRDGSKELAAPWRSPPSSLASGS